MFSTVHLHSTSVEHLQSHLTPVTCLYLAPRGKHNSHFPGFKYKFELLINSRQYAYSSLIISDNEVDRNPEF
jgi:hypothetical protein